ncbi:hypothetical protein ACQPW1_30130 [Nocardia sp. CA-128927]|uniref:hypothetical protein n=1 Tax=Nocardia sp. CA-128927 TaxID=3239975 RepID=UPI003D96F229
MSETTTMNFGAQTQVIPIESTMLTIRSAKSYFQVITEFESILKRLALTRMQELIAHQDLAGFDAYINSMVTPEQPHAIFFELEQGAIMRLAGIPGEAKFYLIGNPIYGRELFRYSGASGLSAPIRVSVSQRDGEETRIDFELPTGLFSRFPEMVDSPMPAILDETMVKILEEVAAS